MRVDIYSHGFRVHDIEPQNMPVINRLCKFMGHWELEPNGQGRYENTLKFVYAGGYSNRTSFQFHINVLDKFIGMVKDWSPKTEIIETMFPLFETDDVDIIRKDMRPPRNGQERAIQFIIDDGDTKVICVEPGGGKTYILNQAMCSINKRLGMVIKAQYLPKWEEDISEAHYVVEGDVLMVKGSAGLILLMRDVMAGYKVPKYVLISNSTYRPYLDLWESTNGGTTGDFPYPITPHDLWGMLGVEVLGIDEGHQDFHFNHRLIIYSHVPKLVVLSGTIDPDNAFKHQVTKLTFPPEVRFVLPPIPPYLRIVALHYGIKNRGKVKWNNRGRPDYSQIALENSILKDKKVLANYTEMMVDLVRKHEKKLRKRGRVGLVFAATKMMCTHLHKAIAKEFKLQRVKRFIGGDPYSTLRTSDIIVTTTKSCGTAKDIPGLAYIIQSEAVGDTQANLQHIKRLRVPSQEDYFTPEFMYLFNEDIKQHSVYSRKKKEIFANIAIAHVDEYSDYEI